MKDKSNITSIDSIKKNIPQAIKPYQALTKEEQDIWDSVVLTHPADYFEPCHVHHLEEYCKAISTSRALDNMIDQIDCDSILTNKNDFSRYEKLCRLKSQVVRDASSLATRLRITKQSVHQVVSARAKNNKIPAGVPRPWES